MSLKLVMARPRTFGNGKWHPSKTQRQDGDHKIELLMQG